jgi:putative intracellular protease/amidase
MSKKVLFVLTSHDKKGNTGEATGAYLPEVAHPYEVLRAAGYEIDFTSPKGGQPPLEGIDLKDPSQKAFMGDAAIQKQLATTAKPESIDASRYGAIYYAGGHGTMWDFADNAPLAKLAAAIYDAGGVVAAVCHGPSGLVNVKLANGKHLVDGKRVAAFTDEEERAVKLENVVPFLLASTLVERGAQHVPGENFKPNVVVSARLVTGQNPASAKGVGEKMVEVLAG